MKLLMLSLVLIILGLSVAAAPGALADQSGIISGGACGFITATGGNVPGCGTKEPGIDQTGGLASKIVDTLFYAAGTISFIFVLIGGVRYLTATGDPRRIKGAKDTLLYAIIGLILTFLAIPISGFIIKTVAGG